MASNIVKALVQIQNELKAPKSKFNSFGKYAYRSCEDIMQAVKPLLAKNNLVQTVTDEIELVGDRYYVKSTVTVTDGDKEIKTSALAREPLNKKGMDDAQVTGSASSYARKYALSGMYNIDDNQDTDTQEYELQQATIDTTKYKQDLVKCKTMEQLKSAFTSMPPQAQKALNQVKEDMKSKLLGGSNANH